jgi:hypothetical protein
MTRRLSPTPPTLALPLPSVASRCAAGEGLANREYTAQFSFISGYPGRLHSGLHLDVSPDMRWTRCWPVLHDLGELLSIPEAAGARERPLVVPLHRPAGDDRVPRRMTFVSSDRRLRRLGRLRCLMIPRLRPGQRVSFHIVLQVDADAPPGSMDNNADVTPVPPRTPGTPGPGPPTPGAPPPPPVVETAPARPIARDRAVVRVVKRARVERQRRPPRFTG